MKRILIRGCPTFDVGGGCDLYVVIKKVRCARGNILVRQMEAPADPALHRDHTVRDEAFRLARRRGPAALRQGRGGRDLLWHRRRRAAADSGRREALLQGQGPPQRGRQDVRVLAASWEMAEAPALTLRRSDLDRACKKKEAGKYPPNFELIIQTVLATAEDEAMAAASQKRGAGTGHGTDDCDVEKEGAVSEEDEG